MKISNWMGSIAIPSPPGTPLARLCDTLLGWVDHSRERHHLARLDDRMLADIGLSRADAWAEQSKRFWEK